MRAIVRGIDAISLAFGVLAAITVLLLTALMLYDVVLRYAFNAPTSWGNDVNTQLMGISFVFSIAYALSTDGHVRVDLLYGTGPRRGLLWVDLIGLFFLILPAMIWITLGLWGHWFESYRIGERTGSGGFNPVFWPFKLALFVGFFVLTLQIFAEILKRAASIANPSIEISATTEAPPHT